MSYALSYTAGLERFRLDNGLDLVLAPDPSRPLVTVNLWYHVGSRNERPGKTGLAHLFEHMLFQGSAHVGTNDHFRLIQQVGGVANGSTSFDRTNYYETLPSHCLELGLWLESDRMGFLLDALDQDKLDNQRDVVMNERRERVDNQPYGRAFETLQGLAFPAPHPYGWPIIGWMDDIAGATLEDLSGFFRSHYSPANAVLTLVGDFDPGTARAAVERYFGALSGGPAAPVPSPPGTGFQAASRTRIEDRVELSRLYLAFPAPALTDRAFLSGDLLAGAISSGKTSPLYRELVYEDELLQDVSAGLLPLELGSMFFVVATPRPDRSVEEAEAAIRDRLAGWRREPPTSTDRERALNRALMGYLHEAESFESRADLLGHFTTFFDEPERLDSEPDRYRRVSAKDLLDYAAAWLDPDRAATLWVVPESS